MLHVDDYSSGAYVINQNVSSCLLFTLLNCVDYFSAFALTWILMALYATLLYSLAYPIHAIILFTLHVTIFIVTIIIFACFVPECTILLE